MVKTSPSFAASATATRAKKNSSSVSAAAAEIDAPASANGVVSFFFLIVSIERVFLCLPQRRWIRFLYLKSNNVIIATSARREWGKTRAIITKARVE